MQKFITMNLLNLFKNEEDLTVFATREVIFKEGTPGDAMYVLVAGEVELSVRGHHVKTIRPGELFGEMALIDAEDRSATATAAADSKLVRLNKARFGFLVQQTPFFALHVMQILATRLRNMDNTIG